jgi:iron complex transport system substrate-binding protein
MKRPIATRFLQRFQSLSGFRIVFGATALAYIGCQKSSPLPDAPPQMPASVANDSAIGDSPTSVVATMFPYEVTDGLRRKVTIADVPKRIISLSPKNTEMLFAVGAGDQTIGTTTFCNYPPAATQIEKIGGFSAKSISLERIVDLKPDLVISVGELHAPIIEALERLKIPVIAFAADSFTGLFDDLQLLGRITGHVTEAANLVKTLNERIDQIKDKAVRIPSHERLTVFYYVWGEPLTGAGSNSYLGEMIQFCGGMNIVDDSSTRFPKLTMEVLLVKNPDVILSSTNHSDLISVSSLEARPGWNGLKAVTAKRIHLMDGNLVSRCSPRSVDALEMMAHIVYPDYFAAPRDDSKKSDDAIGKQP